MRKLRRVKNRGLRGRHVLPAFYTRLKWKVVARDEQGVEIEVYSKVREEQAWMFCGKLCFDLDEWDDVRDRLPTEWYLQDSTTGEIYGY